MSLWFVKESFRLCSCGCTLANSYVTTNPPPPPTPPTPGDEFHPGKSAKSILTLSNISAGPHNDRTSVCALCPFLPPPILVPLFFCFLTRFKGHEREHMQMKPAEQDQRQIKHLRNYFSSTRAGMGRLEAARGPFFSCHARSSFWTSAQVWVLLF